MQWQAKGGAHHGKAVVVGRRYLYTGSPNVTVKSEQNAEFCFKMTGPDVHQWMARLALQKQRALPWTTAKGLRAMFWEFVK